MMVSSGFFFNIPVVAICYPIFLYLLYVLIPKINTSVEMPIVVMFFVWPFLMYFVRAMQVDTSTWDYGTLLEAASDYVLEGSMDTHYFAIYPNNKLWTCVLIAFFKAVIVIFPNADSAFLFESSTYFSGCIIFVGMLLYYKIVERAFYRVLFLFMCLPVWLFATFAYTDTAIFLCVCIFISLVKTIELNRSRWYHYIELGVLAAIGYKIKPTFIICYIAFFIIHLIFWGLSKENMTKLSILVMSGAITFLIVSIISNSIIYISDKEADRWGTPATHYFMMGMNSDTNGAWSGEDGSYTESLETHEDKVKGNLKVYRERVQALGIKGMLKFIFINKLSKTWSDSILHVDVQLARKPIRPSIWQQLFTVDGKYYNYSLIYSWMYHMTMLIGIFLSGLFTIKESNNNTSFFIRVLQLTILGLFFFLSIWECTSRYLFSFVPMLLLVSENGWRKTIEKIR